MLIKEVMNQNAEVIHCTCTVAEAAQKMAAGNFGSLPIEDQDKMIGMITDRDIAIRAVAKGLDPKTTSVQECMTEGISYCYEDEEVQSVARKMASAQHRRLPVLNRQKKLVGMVSLLDIARNGRSANITQQVLSMTMH